MPENQVSSFLEWIKATDGIIAAILASATGFFISKYLSKKQLRQQKTWEEIQNNNQRRWEEENEINRKKWEHEQNRISRWDKDKKILYIHFIKTVDYLFNSKLIKNNINEVINYFGGKLDNLPEDNSPEDFKNILYLSDRLSDDLLNIYEKDKTLFKSEIKKTLDKLNSNINDFENILNELDIELSILAPYEVQNAALDLISSVAEKDFNKFHTYKRALIKAIRDDLEIPSQNSEKEFDQVSIKQHFAQRRKMLDDLRYKLQVQKDI